MDVMDQWTLQAFTSDDTAATFSKPLHPLKRFSCSFNVYFLSFYFDEFRKSFFLIYNFILYQRCLLCTHNEWHWVRVSVYGFRIVMEHERFSLISARIGLHNNSWSEVHKLNEHKSTSSRVLAFTSVSRQHNPCCWCYSIKWNFQQWFFESFHVEVT